MSPFIDDHRAVLVDLCRRYRVRSLAVFGSAARDDFGPESDVDLLVEFDPLPGTATRMPTSASARPLEVCSAGTWTWLRLAIRNPYIKADVERTRTLVYAA